jgi:O-antigen ligase
MIDTKKIAAFFIGALILFSAVLSGSIYPAALETFAVAILIVFLITLTDPDRAGLFRLWPAWLLLIVVYISALWTVCLNYTLMQAFALTAFVIFASVAAYAGDGERRGRILTVVFMAAVLVSSYGVYQYYIGFTHTEAYLRQAGGSTGLSAEEISRAMGKLEYRRAFSTLLSPNVMACYLAMVFPVGIALLMLARKGAGKLLYGSGLAIIMFAMALTKSVGGMLALLAGLMVFIALAPRRGGRAESSRGILILAVIALVVLVAGFGIMKTRSGGFFGFEHSYAERLNFWHGAMRIIEGSPINGTGAGTFRVMYSRYIPPGMVETRYAHNVFLQTMSETGIPGFAALLAVLCAFFFRGIIAVRKDPGAGALAAGITGGGAAFFVHNLADFTWYLPETATLFWLYFGLVSSGQAGVAGVRPAGRFARVLMLVFVLVFGFFYAKSLIADARQSGAVYLLAEKGITSSQAARWPSRRYRSSHTTTATTPSLQVCMKGSLPAGINHTLPWRSGSTGRPYASTRIIPSITGIWDCCT